MSLVKIALVLLAAAAAAIVANVALLGLAGGRHEPVGRLSPRAELQAPAKLPSAPAGEPDERADD